MSKVIAGLDHLKKYDSYQFQGNIGLVCHAASVDANLNHAIHVFIKQFGNRFKKIFSPQHGLVGNVQDNMVESPHYTHPYFNLPVYSLYSETRAPKEEWLKDLDVVFFDLQDVGCRIYTYIYTLSLLMKVCEKMQKKVVVLDRPNPVGGVKTEGNILDTCFASFVGMHPIPVRHGWTVGEFAKYAQKTFYPNLKLEIIPMVNWKRSMEYEETKLPWVIPSPNLPTVDTAYTFLSSVYYEGTNISEGRGTTRSLELIGHPKFEAFKLVEHLNHSLKQTTLEGFVLRPHVFLPTFQKHMGQDCGGFQIHVLDRKKYEPWKLGQWLMKEMYHLLGADFQWKKPPYEYVHDQLPIDVINGTDLIRHWIEKNGSYQELLEMDQTAHKNFESLHREFQLYT
jgi:uncharacterized protein YbbC (DUF1343 family)